MPRYDRESLSRSDTCFHGKRRYPFKETLKQGKNENTKPTANRENSYKLINMFGGYFTDREARLIAEQQRIQELISSIAVLFNGNNFKNEISLLEKKAAAEAFAQLLGHNCDPSFDLALYYFNLISNRKRSLLSLYKRLLFEHSHQE